MDSKTTGNVASLLPVLVLWRILSHEPAHDVAYCQSAHCLYLARYAKSWTEIGSGSNTHWPLFYPQPLCKTYFVRWIWAKGELDNVGGW